MVTVKQVSKSETLISAPGRLTDSPELAALRIEPLRSLSSSQLVNVSFSIIVIVLLTAVYWNVVGAERILIWSITALAISGYQILLWIKYRGKVLPTNAALKFAKSATVHGLVYGSVCGFAGFMLFPAGEPIYQVLLLAILCTAAAAGAIMLAAVPAASIYFVIPALLPFAVTALSQQTALSFALAAAAAVFGLTMIVTIRWLHQNFLDKARILNANDALTQDLESTRTDLVDVMTRVHEALAIFDANDRLVICNQAFQQFPHSASTNVMPGMPFEMLLRGPLPQTFIDGEKIAADDYFKIRMNQRNTGKVIEQKRGDRWYMTSDYPSRSGGTVTTHIDITETKEREEALIQAIHNAENSNRAKSSFLALMSHELRTPLNAIIGFSEMLESEPFGAHSDPQYKEYAASIREAGAHLLNIINDILDLSKIEAGKMELQEEEIDISFLLEDAVRYVQQNAERTGLNVILDIPANLPILTADLRHVRQMLLNLLSNAIKFSPSGSNIIVQAQNTDEGLFLRVKDQGIGIAAEDIDKVLEPFGQARSRISGHQAGTGLGLPLVRSMMELHGGVFHLESEFGVGTKATLHFGADRTAKEAG